MEFSAEEVTTIRRLADLAVSEAKGRRGKEINSTTQLDALSRLANNVTLENVLLEIDVRAHDQPPKLGRQFAQELSNALRSLAGETAANREKRALFIKYIRRLRKGG